MGNKMKICVIGLIVILSVAAVFSVVQMNNRYDVIDDVSRVKEQAEEIYATGDIYSAISKLETYCAYVSTDIDAKITLGDWYLEAGNNEKAYECYYSAASNKKLQEERIPSLSVKNKSEIILEPIDSEVIVITPDVRITKDMTLVISSHNLVPEGGSEGRIVGLKEDLSNPEYRTTNWFEVDPEGEYLTMSGGFNCAVWQFKNADGEITYYAESENDYRKKSTDDVSVYQMARAAIPEGSAWCRVTYYNKYLESETASPDEELTIVYGRLPGESRSADYSYYEIPDLTEGEKIVYENGVWSLFSGNEVTTLDWKIPTIERGSYLAIDGTLPGSVSFENSTYSAFAKDGIYTVRFDRENPSAMGERMDDAKNLGFNASAASSAIALGENHFDNIYPWSEMKLCTLKDGEVVSYEGEAEFYFDGSNGDLFVEIPKFYVRRIVDEAYDTISISGVCHEGFEVDSAFLTADGEADKIYIAAYLTSENSNGEMVSAAGGQPVFGLTPDELNQKTREKGYGYSEMDYAALSCVQKLFMVETGLRNSQYLYLGVCAYTIAEAEDQDAQYAVALSDKTKTNCVVVDDKYTFEEGNHIVIFDCENIEESLSKENRDVRVVKTVIDNEDGTLSVFFNGDSIDVKRNITAVAHTALSNGTTRSVDGHTGAMSSTARGTIALKYRNIENLWGNAYVYIDGVTVKDSRVTLTDRAGNKKELSYILPNTNNVTDNIVKKLGYDPQNSQVMLPSFAGEDATISTYYGDSYFSGNESGKEYVLHFGGGWSSKASAGLFSYSAEKTAYETRSDATGRMMYVK